MTLDKQRYNAPTPQDVEHSKSHEAGRVTACQVQAGAQQLARHKAAAQRVTA